MANPEHVKIVRQGAAAIAEWRRQNPSARLDLARANLVGVDLGGADLSGADLSESDLRRADLMEAKLSGANLFGAILFAADLTGACLSGADLREAVLAVVGLPAADLTGANLAAAELTAANLAFAELPRCNLAGANLAAANLTGAGMAEASLDSARLNGTSFGDCDLSRAKGLSAASHRGPSSVGIDTLVRSFRGAGNKLTADLETFFLGAGVPKELLDELPHIVAEVKYYSCFISYGQPDLDFATRLRGDLAAKGVSCWLYDLDSTPGEPTWAEIGQKRREADKMVVICSAPALIRPGALKEIEEQIDEDPAKIIPISLDNLWKEPGFQVARAGRDLKPFLLDKNYADFSDESRHEESLQRVLKALRRKGE